MRIGHGYDVHRLVPGRDLILGGVKIDWDLGLDGHSDADVLTHAVMDALLGAAALGDIGHLFPDDDPRYLGIDSLVLLRQVADPGSYCSVPHLALGKAEQQRSKNRHQHDENEPRNL